MQTNYNVTFKIVDKRQLNYSAHENIVLDFQDNDFVSAHNDTYPLHSLFDGVSKLDTTDNFTTQCYFPIFMPKLGNIEKYGDIRKQEIHSLLEDYKHVLKSKNVIPIVIDSLETNPDIKTIITDFSHLCPNGLYGITADAVVIPNDPSFPFDFTMYGVSVVGHVATGETVEPSSDTSCSFDDNWEVVYTDTYRWPQTVYNSDVTIEFETVNVVNEYFVISFTNQDTNQN